MTGSIEKRLIEELGEHKLLVYNWMLKKRYDGNDWVVILTGQQAAEIAPKIMRYYASVVVHKVSIL